MVYFALMIILVASTALATVPETLIGGFNCVGIQTNPAIRTFADELTRDLNRSVTLGSTSAMNFGAIDSTMSVLGPVILDHAETLGAGKFNFNAFIQHSHNDHLFSGPGSLVLSDTRAGIPQQEEPGPADVLLANLLYHLDVRTTLAVFSATYGITDHVDLSVVLPIIREDLQIDATLHIPQAGTRSGHVETKFTGIGDIGIRAKYGFQYQSWQLAASLRLIMPSGDSSKGMGTGDVFLTPAFVATRYFWGGKGEFQVNVGLNIDTNDLSGTDALYGFGVSTAIIPKWLGWTVEFTGISELGNQGVPIDTGVLYFVPSVGFEKDQLFGFEFSRHDFLNVSFGFRFRITEYLRGFILGAYALNEVGISDTRITPTVGIGANF